MSVKIAAQFKKDARVMNGLDEIVDELLKEPREKRYVVAEISVKRITEDVEDGSIRTPTVNLVHIEHLDGKDGETAHRLLQKAYLRRTGDAAVKAGQHDLFSDADADEPEQD